MLSQLGGGVQWSKPPGLVCHICGREYGTTSLAIHLPQCAQLWKDRQKLLPRSERRPVPKAPMSITDITAMKVDSKDVDAMDRFNRQQMDAFTSKSLLPCQHCGRRFLEEKLPIHQRSCTADKPAAAVGSHRLKQAEPVGKAAQGAAGAVRAVGALAPYSSYQEAKGAEDVIVSSKGYDLSQLALDAAAAAASDMVPCSLCGRKFTSDRVGRHEAVCTGSQVKAVQRPPAAVASAGPARSSVGGKDGGKWKAEHSEFVQAIQYAKKLTAMQKAGVDIAALPPPPPAANVDYIECPHCLRRFNRTAGERHIPACANTINKPKPPPQRRPTATAQAALSSTAPAGGGVPNKGVAKGGMGRKGSVKAAATMPISAEARVGKGRMSASAGDLQSQLQQLTATVAVLAQQVNSGKAVGSSKASATTTSACKSCAGALPPSSRFCSHCGTPQA